MDSRKTKIKELIISRLNLKITPAQFGDDAKLFVSKDEGGIGLDSVDTLEIAVGLMNEFDIEISDEDMHIFESINTIDKFIGENL
jgi:acyl carrier protein